MTLSHQSLVQLVMAGQGVIFHEFNAADPGGRGTPVSYRFNSTDKWKEYLESRIGPASIDLTLGNVFYRETNSRDIVNLQQESTHLSKVVVSPGNLLHPGSHYILHPGEFVLASVRENVNIPTDMEGNICLKSSIARAGLEHSYSGYIDPGYSGTITLEFRNNLKHHPIALTPGTPIVQLRLQYLDQPTSRSYKESGQYNGDQSTQPSKGAK